MSVKKRALSLVLTFAMLLGLTWVPAKADSEPNNIDVALSLKFYKYDEGEDKDIEITNNQASTGDVLSVYVFVSGATQYITGCQFVLSCPAGVTVDEAGTLMYDAGNKDAGITGGYLILTTAKSGAVKVKKTQDATEGGLVGASFVKLTSDINDLAAAFKILESNGSDKTTWLQDAQEPIAKLYTLTGVAQTVSKLVIGDKDSDVTSKTVWVDGSVVKETSESGSTITGGTIDLTAVSTGSNAIAASNFTWAVSSTGGSGVTVDSGVVTVDPKAKAVEYTITATPNSAEVAGEAKTVTITVTRKDPALASYTIKNGSTTVVAADANSGSLAVPGGDGNVTLTVGDGLDQYGDSFTIPSLTVNTTPTGDAMTVTYSSGNTFTVANATKTGTISVTAGSIEKTITVTHAGAYVNALTVTGKDGDSGKFSDPTVTINGEENGVTLTTTATDNFSDPTTGYTLSIANAQTGVSATVDGKDVKVAGNSKAGTFDIVATDNADSSKKVTKTITVARSSAVANATTMAIGANPTGAVEIPVTLPTTGPDKTVTLTLTGKDQFGDNLVLSGTGKKDVTWTLKKGDSSYSGEDVTLTNNEDGTATLRVKAAAKDTIASTQDFTITATVDTDKSKETTVTVKRAASVVTAVSVSPSSGTALIPLSGTKENANPFTATVTDQYGATMAGKQVTWSLVSSNSNVTVASDTGKITVKAGAENNSSVQVKATSATKPTVSSDPVTVNLVKLTFDDAITGVLKANPTYGDTWGEIVKVKIGDADAAALSSGGTEYTAKENTNDIAGKLYLAQTLTDTPDAGDAVEWEIYFHAGSNTDYSRVTVASGTVAIAKKTLTVTGLSAPDHPYDGTTTVTLNSGTLSGIISGDESKVTATMPTSGTVTSATVGNNKAVSFSTITLSGEKAGNYELTQPTVTVNIIKNSGDATVDFSKEDHYYTGSTQEPATITVTVGGATVDPNEYDVTYTATGTGTLENNLPKGVGTYTVSATAKGEGNYSFAKTDADGSFTIQKAQPTVTLPKLKTGLTYTGAAQDLITAGSSEHGTFSYMIDSGSYGSDRQKTDAGTYTIYYKFTGDASHGDISETKLGTVTIAPKTVTSPTITLAAGPWTYTGSAVEPSVTAVKDSETTINSSEYAVSYSNNVNAGAATVTITDKDGGNYVVSGSTTFTIGKATISSPTVTIAGWAYGATPSTPSVSSNPANASVTYEYKVQGADDGTYSTTVPTTPGSYTVRAKIAETKNYEAATTAGANFTIAKAANPAVVQTAVTVRQGTSVDLATLVSGAAADIGTLSFAKTGDDSKFTLTGSTVKLANDATGSCTFTVSATGSGNYEALSATEITVTATDKKVQNLAFTNTSVTKTYGDGSFTITPTGAAEGATVTYAITCSPSGVATIDSATGAVTIVKAGTATITATAEATGEYAAASASYQLTVNKKDVTVKPVNPTAITVGDPAPALGNTVDKDYKIEGLVGTDTLTGMATLAYSPAEVDTNKAGSWTITVSGLSDTSGNYNVKFATGTLTIKAKAPVTPTTPTTPSSTDTSTIGGGGGGGGYTPRDRDTDSSTTTNKNTTTNADGSTTTTVKNSDGSVTETTRATDGSTTTKTEKTGEATTTEKAADGSTGTTKTDANGNTVAASATVSQQAVRNAARYGSAVKVPVSVKASNSAASAAAVEIALPETSEPVAVEIPVENASAGTVAVIVHPDGTEEIVKTSTVGKDGVVLTLDGSAKVKIVDNSKYFADVPSYEWYSDNVAWASSHEIMNGTGDFAFAPNDPTSRSMVAQLLFNLDGATVPAEITTLFADVNANDWYAASVNWAVNSGVARGMGDDLFGANQVVTREQFAVMMYNYAKLKGYDVSTTGGLVSFPDAGSVSDWAADAMAWAVGVGLINGTTDADGNTVLNAQGTATRAQVAAIMQRFCEKVAK